MSGITFINPAMFLGLLTITIPIAIHLLTRRAPVLITFPTLRFLHKAQANQSRLFRIRHYLLLLIRTLVVLLLLAAFLRPVLTKGTLAAAGTPEGGTAAIVILDTSLSMGYAASGISPYARASSSAETILNQLGGEDLANVIFAGAVPRATFEGPRPNRAQLRADLAEQPYSLARADIDAAIALALEQFDALKDRNLELHFVSDFQRTNWAAVDFSVVPASVKTVFVSVAEERPANLAITALALRPANPALGERAEVTCSVSNYGPAADRVNLALDLGGGAPLEQEVSVEAGATATASFAVQFSGSGIHEAVASIGDGALLEDNTRYLAFRVSERFPITILSAAPPDARGASHRFLAAALDPLGDGTSVFVPEVMPPDQFDRFAAARSHAVIITQAGSLGAGIVAVLKDYLNGGGNVVYFADSPADRDNLALLAGSAEDGVKMPFSLAAYAGADDGAYAVLASANYEEPMLKKFRDTDALAGLHFFRYFETRRAEAQGQVLLKYDNGNIALARTSLGLGSLLLANFSPALDGSDLQKSTAFVPLVHEMLKALDLTGGGGREFAAGYPCSTSITLETDYADAPVRFTNPSGEEIDAVLDMNGANGSVIVGETPQTGFYRVFNGAAKAGSIAVNTDARESNLETLAPAQLETMTQRSRENFYARTGADAGTLRKLREGVPLWHYCLAGALAFLAVEQGLAFLWRR